MQIRKGGQVKIAAKFRSFYINKMNADDYSKARNRKAEDSSSKVVFKKKPYVSATSRAMAAEARKRTDNKGHVDIVEHLYEKERTKKAMKDQMVNAAIIQAANEEDE